MFIIQTPNGLKANDTLNKVASQLQKRYKNSNNIKWGFTPDFDGQWSLEVEVVSKNRAIVLKQDADSRAQQVFFYFRDYKNQPLHDHHTRICNCEVFDFINHTISEIYKLS